MTTINVDGEVFDAPRIRAMTGRVHSSEAERDALRAENARLREALKAAYAHAESVGFPVPGHISRAALEVGK